MIVIQQKIVKNGVAAVVTLVILVGLINNAKNIRNQPSYISGQSAIAPKPANNVQSVSRATSSKHDFVDADCLKARKDTVPVSFFRKLPKPYINLGFPKMGTSSLHAYFKCGGLVSTHYFCNKDQDKLCTKCMKGSVKSGQPPLSQCGKADMYAQIDDGRYFPQIELLEELVHGHPNATFFLTYRSMEKWYQSISHWPPKLSPKLDERFKKLHITGSPSNEGISNLEEFSDWYCKHVQRVRHIVSQNPSHTLVEVNIEDPGIGQRMEEIFGIEKSCWGQKNVNLNIHPEVDQSEVALSRTFRHKEKTKMTLFNQDEDGAVGSHPGSKGEDGMNDTDNDVDDDETNSAAENELNDSLDSEAAEEEHSKEDDYEISDTDEKSRSQSPDMSRSQPPVRVQVTKAVIRNRAKRKKEKRKIFGMKRKSGKHQQKQKFIYQPNPAQHESNT
mmetsp:Transcript_27603/g.49740  ORF Transcript_27603/g.49740 Transcript_27603/m.49740 type:complete len:445 (-) Transcript_27603:167-1501(-)